MASLSVSSKKKICFASGTDYEPFENSTSRVQLQLLCPNSILDSCEKEVHIWHCVKCNETIQRDSDNNFYCACGKAGNENFTFKCSSEYHGPDFLSFLPGTMTKFLKEIPELNILVIGIVEEETTTWINSFVNYLAFPTLQDAVDETLVATTPLSFRMVDQNDVLQKIKFGDDKTDDGNIRVNLFAIGNTLVRLIDIPGIRGNSEVENIKKIYRELLLYLWDIKVLHGVCFLPKPDVYFELCFKEFVTQFSYRAMRNIVFCFTGQKYFKSVSMREFLTKLLRKNKLDINLDNSQMYNMDAECFRFVCAFKQGIRFNEEDGSVFSKRWAASAEESKRLVSYLKSLKPHNIEDTLSVIEAKIAVVYFSFAISHMIENLTRKLAEIYSQMSESKAENTLVVTELNVQVLPHLQTVCSSPKCFQSNANSFAVCHENCLLEGIPLAIAGDENVGDCSAMSYGDNLYCRMCRCFWDEHMQINCDLTFKKASFTGQVHSFVEWPMQLQPIPPMKKYSQQIAAKVKELAGEQMKIIKTSVKVGHFLSKRSYLSYSDRMLHYMRSFIIREERETDEGIKSSLVAIRNLYFEEEKFCLKTNAEELEKMGNTDFEKLVDELCGLKHSGNTLKLLLAGWKREEKIVVREVFHDLTKISM